MTHRHSHLETATGWMQRRARPLLTVWAALFLLLGGYYLWQVNQAGVAGYQIEALRQHRDQLQTANESLRVEVTSLQGMERLAALSQQLQLVQPLAVEYLALPGAVARR